MAKVETYSCDICGNQKGETNHWMISCSSKESIQIVPWGGVVHEAYGVGSKIYHLCSDSCCIKFTQQWLSERKSESEASKDSVVMAALSGNAYNS